MEHLNIGKKLKNMDLHLATEWISVTKPFLIVQYTLLNTKFMFLRSTEKSVWDKFPELKRIQKDKFPTHLLLIPDGNGRWAKLAHKNITEGHKKGAEAIKNIYNDLWQLPIKYISIWGFSADNWSRTKEEA